MQGCRYHTFQVFGGTGPPILEGRQIGKRKSFGWEFVIFNVERLRGCGSGIVGERKTEKSGIVKDCI
jgi:hypothetical protein